MPTHAGFFVGSGCTHHAHGGRVRWRWSCGGLHGDGLAVPGMRAARDMGSTGLLDALFPCAQLFFQPCGTFRIHVSRGLVVLRGNGVLEHRHAGFLQVGPGATDIARLGKACAKDFARSEEHTSELQSPCKLVCRLLPEKQMNSAPNLLSNSNCMRESILIDCVPSCARSRSTRSTRLRSWCSKVPAPALNPFSRTAPQVL